MGPRSIRPIRAALVGVVVTAAAVVTAAPEVTAGPGRAPPPTPVILRHEVIGAPDPGTTELGGTVSSPGRFAFDGTRIAALARVDGQPVVLVFARTGSGWTRTATLRPPAGAVEGWGRAVSIRGDTIAVGIDPGFPGTDDDGPQVEIYRQGAAGWALVQSIPRYGQWDSFGAALWLTDTGLVVVDSGSCDSSCSYGRWYLYQRDGSGTYQQRYDSADSNRPGTPISASVDGNRVAVANPGFVDFFSLDRTFPSSLAVIDTAPTPPVGIVDRVVPFEYVDGQPYEADRYRRVALGDGRLVYEHCCDPLSELHVERQEGGGYVPDAVVPITRASSSLDVVPGVILQGDRSTAGWHTFVRSSSGGWAAGVDLPAPDAVAGAFWTDPVSVGAEVLVGGDGVLHVLTVAPAAAPAVTCDGRAVTVDLGAGQRPTDGPDVILGTARTDLVDGGGGADVVCGLGGVDLLVGGAGDDVVLGGAGTDLVLGGPGHDDLRGEAGDDLLLGGAGRDRCDGGPGRDVALLCERVTGVP